MPRLRSWIRLAAPAALALMGTAWLPAGVPGTPQPGPVPSSSPPFPSARVQFNRDIRPILSDHCFACHGFDPKTRKADLRLDTPDGAYGAGASGAVAIRPGELEASELWRRVATSDPDDRMPPADTHKQLSTEQTALLRRWIEEGAPYQKHWAFEAPVRAEPPVLRAGLARTPAHPVDRFLRARLEQEMLTASPEASRPRQASPARSAWARPTSSPAA